MVKSFARYAKLRKWQQFSAGAVNALAQLLKPRCASCQLPASKDYFHTLCDTCFNQMPRSLVACTCCGLPLSVSKQAHSTTLICGQCQQQPSDIHRTVSLAWYQRQVQQLMQRFKYHGDQVAGRALTAAWLKHHPNPEMPQVLIPVPSHSSKLHQRGFNPASIIAYDFAKQFDLEVDENCCHRLIPGSAQAGTSKAQRRRQVKGMYRVLPNNYQHIAIVDDVVTTQATVAIIAKQFKQQGVERVDVWCIARTP